MMTIHNKMQFKIEELEDQNKKLKDALGDMLSGWLYIRDVHGDLYGVGWDRAQKKAEDALKSENGD